MPFNIRKTPKQPGERVADLEAEDRKRIELYRIYGNQNPPIRTRRGRVFD